jgi:hypothetical protein
MPMTPYYFTRQRHARFYVTASATGLAFLAVIVLFLPTESRRVKTLLTSVSEALVCAGPITAAQAESTRHLVEADFSETTTVTISGAEAINGSFSADELLQQFTELCAHVSRFHVDLTQVSVDILGSGQTAHARADASVEYVFLGRTEREHRLARFTIRREGQAYRIVAAEMSAKVVNQPEPRP